MSRFKPVILAVICALFMAACGSSSTPKDDTAGWSAQQLYSEAKSLMNEGSYERAIEMFEKLEARYPYGRYAQQAQLEVAYGYYKSNEPALALTAADRFIRLHPNHQAVDYVYYLKGLITFNDDLGLLGGISNQDLSERDPKGAREAFEAFRELITRFPESRYVDDARLRMQYLVNLLATNEAHIARYYYKRGAYVAAINRAKAVVTDYPQAPAQEEALYLMMKSYEALGMTELQDDTSRVFLHNFPDSVYLRGGPKDTRPWWQIW